MTVTTEPGTGTTQAWRAPLIREGQRTGDGRLVGRGATVWGADGQNPDHGPDFRELPLPFGFQPKQPDGGLGGNPHAGAIPVGAVTHIWHDPEDPDLVWAAGWYDDPVLNPDAGDAARKAANGMVAGISADLDDCDGEPGEDGGPVWTHARVMGATQCMFQALPGSKVSVISAEEFAELAATVEALAAKPPSDPPPASGGDQTEPPDGDDTVHDFTDSTGNGNCDTCGLNEDGHDAAQALLKTPAQATQPVALGGARATPVRHVTALEALTAAGSPRPWGHEAWYQDPDLKPVPRMIGGVLHKGTPLTVTDEVDELGCRRVFGHGFEWGVPHTALGGTVTPPRSRSGYAYFMLHGQRTRCDCPDKGGQVEIPVGYLTFGCGHPRDPRRSLQDALGHYDNVGWRAVAVAFGEDDIGGWFAGATSPDLTDQQLDALYGSTVSGDWQWIGGVQELVAVTGVNVAGFPIPRGPAFHLSQGRPTSLVAAGIVPPAHPVEAHDPDRGESLAALQAQAAGFDRRLASVTRLVDPAPARDALVSRLRLAYPDLAAYERESALAVRLAKDPKKPYGDVTYADPGFKSDKQKRYPIDNEGHVRAAWSYINQSGNQSGYTSGQVASIKTRIKTAGRKYGIKFADG